MRNICLLLLLAAPVLAQDAATRYHDAYVLEVVEGKPAEAARTYLALANDDKTPDRIRRQAQFRFAVTCVLLGRADEARARLAALATEDALPKGLRAQVEEYRKSLQGVERGSALEKKMDELKFRLARSNKATPQEYREFEVIGEPAIPYLRRLARHRDRGLRLHAVRLLARMNAPDVVEIWHPSYYALELPTYFRRHQKQLPAVLKQLERAKAGYVSYLAKMPLPLEWLREQRRREDLRPYMPQLIRGHWGKPEVRDLFVEWMRGKDGVFAVKMANMYVRYIDEETVTMAEPTILPDVMRLMRGEQGFEDELRLLASKSSTDALVQTLNAEVEAGSLAFAEIAGAELLRRKELPRYEGPMRRWLFAALAKKPGRKSEVEGLRQLVERLPVKQAVDVVRKLYAGLDVKNGKRFAPVIGCARAEDAPLFLAALDVSRHEALLFYAADKGKAPFWRALQPSYAPLLGQYPELAPVIAVAYKKMAPLLGRDAAIKLGEDLVAGGRRLPLPARESFYGNLIAMGSADRMYREHVAPAVFDAVSKDAGPDMRRKIVSSALYALYRGAGTAKQRYLRHIEPNLSYAHGDVLSSTYSGVVAHVPAEWYVASAPLVARHLLSSGSKDRVYQYFTSHPKEINANVVIFLDGYEPRNRSALLAPLFATEDEKLLRMLLARNLHTFVPIDALKGLLANEKLPLDLQAIVGNAFASARPTRALFPLVRRVLAAKDRDTVVSGIAIAKSLGSEELLPDLSRLLDTLDARVRDEANEAIQSIVTLRKLKAELQADIAGVKKR